MTVLDAAGLSLLAVTGASKAIGLGFGPAQAVIVGAITAVGGGTLRDVLVRRIPSVLTGELYAIPALIGATALVVLSRFEAAVSFAAIAGAALCFVIRMVGVRFGLNAPYPLGAPSPGTTPEEGPRFPHASLARRGTPQGGRSCPRHP